MFEAPADLFVVTLFLVLSLFLIRRLCCRRTSLSKPSSCYSPSSSAYVATDISAETLLLLAPTDVFVETSLELGAATVEQVFAATGSGKSAISGGPKNHA